jgi:hypothetical protein
VGFRFGSYVEGTTNVGPVDDMPHVTASMKLVVQVISFALQLLDNLIFILLTLCNGNNVEI